MFAGLATFGIPASGTVRSEPAPSGRVVAGPRVEPDAERVPGGVLDAGLFALERPAGPRSFATHANAPTKRPATRSVRENRQRRLRLQGRRLALWRAPFIPTPSESPCCHPSCRTPPNPTYPPGRRGRRAAPVLTVDTLATRSTAGQQLELVRWRSPSWPRRPLAARRTMSSLASSIARRSAPR